MNYPQFIMGFILVIAGLSTYFLAPRMGPNHWFGVRYSYTMINQQIWDKTNRLGGLLFLGAGVFLELLALVMPTQWEPFFVILGVGLVLLIIVVTYFYAKKLAQEEPREEFIPTPGQERLRKIYLIVALTLTILLLGVSIWYYPLLPNKMATHFLADGQPDDWIAKPLALVFPIVIQSFLIFLFYLTYREQEKVFYPQAKVKGIPLQVQLGIFFSIHLLITFASLDVIYYNLSQVHLLKMDWVLFIVTALVIFPPLFFYWLYRRKETFKGL